MLISFQLIHNIHTQIKVVIQFNANKKMDSRYRLTLLSCSSSADIKPSTSIFFLSIQKE